VNAVTLSELLGDREKVQQLSPVVEYAVMRKMERKTPDYWDHATLFELAVIQNDEEKATRNLENALTSPVESWMFDTTIKNLRLISEFRSNRKEDNAISEKMIEFLESQKAFN
jgi:hypothetical protein